MGGELGVGDLGVGGHRRQHLHEGVGDHVAPEGGERPVGLDLAAVLQLLRVQAGGAVVVVEIRLPAQVGRKAASAPLPRPRGRPRRSRGEFRSPRRRRQVGEAARHRDGGTAILGRGGSDTSAVAMAAALKADVCEIYTDVDGVYTTDPNICKEARKMEKISYDEMLELASLGAKVLQIRSVEFAKKYNVDIHVRSSFNDNPGTMVTKEDKDMEAVLVSGIAYDKNEAKIAVMHVPDKPGIAAKLLTPLSDAERQ